MPTTNVITPAQGPIALPFTELEITQAINVLPVQFGQLAQEGMFPDDPTVGQLVQIDIINGVLTALPVTEDGAPTVAKHDGRDVIIFRIPKIKHQDDVLAGDIKSMLSIAARFRGDPETFSGLFNQRLQRLRNKFDLTRELMRMSALKGIIVDGAGTALYNLYEAFGLTKKIVYFDLTNANADIDAACDQVHMLITQDLSDEVMTRVRAKVSRRFFSRLVGHAKVKEKYLQSTNALALANIVRGKDGGYMPRTFEYGNILFEEYSAVVPMWGGANTPIVTVGKGHAFPDGTLDTHVSYVAPPDDIRQLEGGPASLSDVIHVTTELMKHGAGVEMLGQMHALPLWKRPNLLVELDDASGSSTVSKDGV
jgi:hypothetical protein